MKARTRRISDLIKQNIGFVDSKAEIILYGSRARGDERNDSDWDILVLTDYPVNLSQERVFRDKIYDLELEIGEPFSIFVYSKNDWTSKQKETSFFYNVTQEGIKI